MHTKKKKRLKIYFLGSQGRGNRLDGCKYCGYRLEKLKIIHKPTIFYVYEGHNNTVYSVMGLHPFSVYSFKVVAVNGVGLSKESEQSYYMITLREV